MVEAVVLWNEPNNLSHWNFHLDPGWERFAAMIKAASAAIRRENPSLPIVLGGVSSADPDFLLLMRDLGVLAHVDAVGCMGFLWTGIIGGYQTGPPRLQKRMQSRSCRSG